MLFGSSGIRRKYSRELVELAMNVGSAVGREAGHILLGSDTRRTGQILAHAVISGVLASGGDVTSCGIVPTPAVAYCTRNFTAGCMVTASHNPEEYNGLKLFNPDGSSFTRHKQQEVELRVPTPVWTDWEHQGSLKVADLVGTYRAAVRKRIQGISGLRMVLDCGNGAGCMASPALLGELGVSLTCINCSPSGHFSRPSEPLKEHLSHIKDLVRSTGSAGAVVHDGDADRMMAFDQDGTYISGDHLLMLFARYLGAEKVVTTFDASMAIEEIATVRRTPVGDSYVSEALLEWGDFGGEPSGAWIFPGHSLCPDGPYAAALFCEIASEWNIAEEIRAMPSYPILRESLPCETAARVLHAMGAENPTDGIRLSGDEGWCLIRASGTEPRIRLTAEGTTNSRARSMMEQGRALVKRWKSA